MVCIALFTFAEVFWNAKRFLYRFVRMARKAVTVQYKNLLASLQRLDRTTVIKQFDVLDSEIYFIAAVDLCILLLVLIIFVIELIYIQIKLIFHFTFLKLIFSELIVVFDRTEQRFQLFFRQVIFTVLLV